MNDKPAVNIIDLGWENGWEKEPKIVTDCKAQEHKPYSINHDPTHRGLHTEYGCKECGWRSHVDSSG